MSLKMHNTGLGNKTKVRLENVTVESNIWCTFSFEYIFSHRSLKTLS